MLQAVVNSQPVAPVAWTTVPVAELWKPELRLPNTQSAVTPKP